MNAPVAYLAILLLSGLLAWYLTPLAFSFARQRGLLDRPGGHKTQSEAVPYLGGAAIVGAFAVAVLIGALILRPPSGLGELTVVVVAAVALAAVGLADDVWGLGPWVRLAVEAVAAFAVWQSGVGATLTGHVPLDATLTILWVVGITNAVNLLDNMDGLAAGIVFIASMAFFVLALVSGQTLVATLSIALAGCAAGFLRHNFHPARVYMGDAGSLFLGFMLAVLGMKLRLGQTAPEIAALVPPVVLGVALLDTGLVSSTRLLHRRQLFSGGRDHISHRLVFLGLPVPVAVRLIYAAAIGCGWLGLVLAYAGPVAGFLLAGFVLVAAVAGAIGLARVPVYETSNRRRFMVREVKPHEKEPGGNSPDSGDRDHWDLAAG